ncbi:MAG: outer membrane protein transport protein [Elusimicrobiales bacterium]|nr:outer membrane protein transport protein [Elusimicrobiales bacterium]
MHIIVERIHVFPRAAVLAACCFFNLVSGAAASGYEFDGIGAKAVARGGAVIADAADWTAIYWNPAALSDVKSREAGLEIRAGYSYSKDGDSFTIPLGGGTTYGPFDKDRAHAGFVIGSLGAVVPLDARSAIAVGAYTPLLQGADFRDTAPGDLLVTALDYSGSVAVGVANVSYSRKLTEKFSAGIGVDVIYGSLSSDSTIGWSATAGLVSAALAPVAGKDQTNKKEADGYGIEGVAGVTWQHNDEWRFGAVARSGARVPLKGAEKVYLDGAFQQKSDFTLPVHHPATTGIGAAWQVRKDLKLTCDFAQTWWKAFSNALTYEDPGGLLNDSTKTYHWKNSYKFRFGALKRVDERTEVSAGYAYDTPAIDGDSIDFSTAIDVPMHRFSAALTHDWSPLEATIGALAGAGRRTAHGVDYSLKGWYVIGEARYRF